MSGLDLKEIQKHIEKERVERTGRAEALGESIVNPVTGDKFLNELKTTVVSGKLTNAAVQVKAVNQATMVKDGEKNAIDPNLMEQIQSTPQANVNVNHNQPNQYNIPPNQTHNNGYPQQTQQTQQAFDQYGRPIAPVAMNESDRGLYAEMERKMNEMHGIQNPNGTAQPLTSAPVTTSQVSGMPPQSNNYLVEQVHAVFNNFVNESLGTVLQEAMKDTIVETYKVERVGVALRENKDAIKKIVLEVIRDLQNTNKKKKST